MDEQTKKIIKDWFAELEVCQDSNDFHKRITYEELSELILKLNSKGKFI